MRAGSAALLPRMRLVGGYHLCWWDEHGEELVGGAGKGIRSALLLATTRALGGDEEEALAPAAAVEFLHNFTLLHDDVMDRDTVRRHRPTAWTVFGETDAILSGDALFALSLRLVAESGHPAAPTAVALLADCAIEAAEGESLDCSFPDRAEISLAECLAMVQLKTGALLGCTCALGALYAGAGRQTIADMDAFGRNLGLAFQLVDDLIGIWGDPAKSGKGVGADLVAGKKSVPIVVALAAGNREAAQLRTLLGSGNPLTAADVRRATELIEAAGAREWVQSEAARYAALAGDHLVAAVPDPGRTGELRALAELVTNRAW